MVVGSTVRLHKGYSEGHNLDKHHRRAQSQWVLGRCSNAQLGLGPRCFLLSVLGFLGLTGSLRQVSLLEAIVVFVASFWAVFLAIEIQELQGTRVLYISFLCELAASQQGSAWTSSAALVCQAQVMGRFPFW